MKIATNLLPSTVRNLVKLTGKRPSEVTVEFQSGPTTVHGAWRTDAKSFGKVVSAKVSHWDGSDGESNTTITEVYDAPVARGNRYGNKSTVTVYIGNLAELCPAEGTIVSPARLGELMAASVGLTVAADGKVTTEVRPGPFNPEYKVLSVRELNPTTKTAQVDFMEQMGCL